MTGIELLRKYAEAMPTTATCGQLPEALGKECVDFESCYDCHRFVCNAIADQIEREAELTCELTKVEVCDGIAEGVTQWRLCSRCGIEVLAWPAAFCPCCGAKVVR